MFSTKIKIITVLAFMLVASTAIAQSAAPGGVTGVSAQYTGGKLTVRWNAVTDPSGIKAYRIYYSRQSILGNSGNYDDFEQTGNTTSFTFDKPPYTGRTIFLSVLAVNGQNVESEGFVEEAAVAIPAVSSSATSISSTSSSSAVSSLASSTSSSINDLRLLGATTLSSTGVALDFSLPLDTTQDISLDTFLIVDASGAQLEITGMEIADRQILLETARQEPNRAYVLGILQEVRSVNGGGLNVSLPQVSFVGFGTPGIALSSASSRASSQGTSAPTISSAASSAAPIDRSAPENPGELNLRASADKNGTYTVSAVWQGSIDSAKDLTGYRVYASTDGVKFQPSGTTNLNATSTNYVKIAPGTFGVRVTAFDKAGNESSGIQRVINLPNSGIGLLGLAAVSGIVAGRKAYRKRKSRILD